ncbi:MAG: twitching motility protein PilT [Clostridia bacterium]|nr:twitching motility protein PilT [Clostridia bacterium]
MITLIYGEKGTGKTKQMIDGANQSAQTAKGVVVYIDKDDSRMHDLDRNIRLVNTATYQITTQEQVVAFVKGMLATNYDIEKIYVDGLAKIVKSDLADMQAVYDGLGKVAQDFNVDFVVSVSCAKENLPAFVSKYL